MNMFIDLLIFDFHFFTQISIEEVFFLSQPGRTLSFTDLILFSAFIYKEIRPKLNILLKDLEAGKKPQLSLDEFLQLHCISRWLPVSADTLKVENSKWLCFIFSLPAHIFGMQSQIVAKEGFFLFHLLTENSVTRWQIFLFSLSNFCIFIALSLCFCHFLVLLLFACFFVCLLLLPSAILLMTQRHLVALIENNSWEDGSNSTSLPHYNCLPFTYATNRCHYKSHYFETVTHSC